jgi:hypothetical protein
MGDDRTKPPRIGEVTVSRLFRTRLGEVRLSIRGLSASDTKMLYLLCNFGVEHVLANLLPDEINQDESTDPGK